MRRRKEGKGMKRSWGVKGMRRESAGEKKDEEQGTEDMTWNSSR